MIIDIDFLQQSRSERKYSGEKLRGGATTNVQSELPNVQEPNLHVRIRNWDVSGMLLSRQLLTAKSHPNYKEVVSYATGILSKMDI